MGKKYIKIIIKILKKSFRKINFNMLAILYNSQCVKTYFHSTYMNLFGPPLGVPQDAEKIYV